MAKLSAAEIDSLLFAEQGSNPATPASGYGRLFVKSDGVYFIDDGGTVTGPLGGGGGAAASILHAQDQQTSGTAGGSSTTGAWTTRVLNTLVTNEIAGASLASNQLTLPSGTYEAAWSAPFVRSNGHQTRLYDVTGAATLALSSNGNTSTADTVWTPSVGRGKFTLASSSTVELQYRVAAAHSTNGLGPAAGWGTEVYADLLLRKVA